MDFKANTNIDNKRWNIVSWNPKKGEKKKKRISYKYLNSSEELDRLKCYLEKQWS